MGTLTKEQINELTKVAEWVKHTPIGYVTQDSAGKIKTTYTDRNTHLWDLTGLSSNNSGGTIVNPDNPGQSDGDNYRAGSIEDGEITDREKLWQGPSSITAPTIATLLKDVGSKFNMVGEGIMITAHLSKTVMTKGVLADTTSNLDIKYDSNNTPQSGYYVSTSSYPAFVLASHFVVGKRLTIPFNGIGEHLNGKNMKAPTIHMTFNADKTITIENETGYDNDGNSAGATGANYDVVVDAISTYSTQSAVSQLPSAINLFVGQASGEIVLSGAGDYFENCMDGIQIYFDQWAYGNSNRNRIDIFSALGFPESIKISKDHLTNGYSIKLNDLINPSSADIKFQSTGGSGRPYVYSSNPQDYLNLDSKDVSITIGKGTITLNNGLVAVEARYVDASSHYTYQFQIDKINSYKD